MHRPLADEIRPKTLDEVVGQRHLLAPGGVLRRLIDAGTDANMVFYYTLSLHDALPIRKSVV